MFQPPENSPLAQRDYARLGQGLEKLNLARRKIDLAKAAGIDCTQREMECDFLQQRIDQLKATYFPHKP